MAAQPSLFDDPRLPAGFRYEPQFLSADEEGALIERFADLPFEPFEFHGHLGRRRVVYFGWRYDFSHGAVQPVEAIPDWLGPVRARAAEFAQIALPGALAQAMVTEYQPGAPIGWHRDRPQFEDVIGISLGAPCTLRFRRKVGAGWERASLTAEPRSIYLLRGPARTEWQHSIPPLAQRRYSIMFRTFR
jgi:alkylated DNA repair dioxygenase AlkB